MHVAGDTATQQLVVFLLGSEEYALPIQTVQEVIRFQEPRAVSSSDPTLLGVINLRGSIVPVHDVRAQLGVDGVAPDLERQKIVLINLDDQLVGVVVDDVSEVLSVDTEEFEDLPASGNALVDGVARVGQRLIILLDPGVLAGLSTEADA